MTLTKKHADLSIKSVYSNHQKSGLNQAKKIKFTCLRDQQMWKHGDISWL